MLCFSSSIEYGLNTLILLAKSKRRLSLQEIADKSQMPYRFLNKVVRPLLSSGLVFAKEGKNGGYALSKSPHKINLKHIYNSMSEPLSIAQCFSSKGCPLGREKTCKVRPHWARMRRMLDRELKKITLKDLL